MARLVTAGFEAKSLSNSSTTTGEPGVVVGAGAVSIDTSVPRSGAACAKCAASANNFLNAPLTTVLGQTYYTRLAVRFSSITPSANLGVLRFDDAEGTLFEITLQTTGKLWTWLPVEAKHLGEESQALEGNVWYVLEAFIKVPAAGNGTVGWLLRNNAGEVIKELTEGTVNVRNKGLGTIRAGHQSSGETAVTVFLDDWAINSDEGENQNGLPGNAKVVMLKPTADVARTGWTAGAGGTTNLWDALNNTPPVGVKSASATNTSQIKDSTSNTTDTYEAKLAAYSTPVESSGGGIGGGDTVKLVATLMRIGNSSSTARNIGITGVSNPAITENVQGTSGTGETDPTGWSTKISAFSYNPSVEKEVQPVLKIRKATASTDAAMVDQIGLLVEYVPAPSLVLQASSGVASTSLALQAKTQVPLQASSGVASATAALAAKTAIPLQASSGVATTSLAIRAPTTIPLGPSSGVATTSLALHTARQIPLQSSSGVATATLSLHAKQQVDLQPSSGVASATLKLRILRPAGIYIRGPTSWVKL